MAKDEMWHTMIPESPMPGKTDPTELIAEARRALEGVTEGPWAYEHRGIYLGDEEYPYLDVQDSGTHNDDANASFIAAARTLVPALADALERAIAERDAAVKVVEAFRDYWDDAGPLHRGHHVPAEFARIVDALAAYDALRSGEGKDK